MTDVSVVIPARDCEVLIAGALDALAAQDFDGTMEVVVVDNGSRDATAQVAAAHPLAPVVIRRERGAGPGAARNDGVAAARAPVIAFTDADCRPAPLWLAEGLRAIAGRDLVQGAVAPPPGAEFGPFDHIVRIAAEYGLYETANLFVRRPWFERVGGFEDLFATGDGRPFGEDAWFAWRLRREGGRTGFSAAALVHHAVIARGPRARLAEQTRLRHFPELARRIPELRGVFFHRRWFLTRRSALFDLALAGAVLFAASRRPLALALAAPYARELRREARRWPRENPALVVGTGVACDALGAGALAAGSVRARTAVL